MPFAAALRLALPTAVLFASLAVPSLASARLALAGSSARETPPRKGLLIGVGVSPGVALLMPRGFVPVTRLHYMIGGAITDRFTLGVDIGGTAILAERTIATKNKFGFNADVVGTGFMGRGFYIRAGLGVASHVPALAFDPFKAGVGGVAGIGYEFRVLERMGLGLGLDYDLRVRTDGIPAQTVTFGLRIVGYLNKK
jgi:hypothetical protein